MAELRRLQYTVLGLCWGVWFLNFGFRMMLPTLMPLIEEDLALTHTQASLLLSAQSLAYAPTILVVGVLADKFGRKPMIILSVSTFSVASILCGLTHLYSELILTLILSGVGLGFYLAAGVSLISYYFGEDRRGRALGAHETAPSAGQALGPIFAGVTASVFGWRYSFLIAGLPGFLLALLFLKFVKEPVVEASQMGGDDQSFKEILRNKSVIILVVCYVLTVIVTTGIASFLPIYFVNDLKIPLVSAAGLYGLSRFMGVFGAVTGGSLSDKLGRKPVMTFSSLLAALCVILLFFLPVGTEFYIALFVYSFVGTFFFPASFAYISSITQRQRATIVGICSTSAMIVGLSFVPFIIGSMADAYGSFRLALLLPAGIAGVFLIFVFVILNKIK